MPSRRMRIAMLLAVVVLAACTRPHTPTPAATTTRTPMPLATASPSPAPIQSPPPLTPTAEAQPSVTAVPSATLRVGWLDAPQELNPLAESPGKADLILALLYDQLIYRALDNTYAPAVARTWTTSDGGKTWVFDLQPRIRTHDGRPFTSEDVAYALSLFQSNFRLRYYGGYTVTLQSIEATGPNTLTLTLSQPVGNIEAFLYWMPLLPTRVEEAGRPDEGKLVGTGPFAWKDYEPGKAITLVANRSYWMGAPRVGAVTFQGYASADELADALRDGTVDLITDVPPTLIATLKSDARIQVVSGPRIHFRQLLFNVSDRTHSTGHPALKDQQVRAAIAHAIDKQQLVDASLLGRGMPGLSIIPPALGKWFNPEIEDMPFDLPEAQRILDGAGYTDRDGDGWREMPGGGKPLSLRLFVASDAPAGSQEADMISNWLRLIGIQVTTETRDPKVLAAAGCATCDYDMMLADREGGADPGFLLSTLTSAEVETGLNSTGYSNPVYDALYHQQASTVGQDQRRSIVWQMQQIAFEDQPCIVLYYDLAVQAFRKDRFKNWLFVPNGVLSLLDQRSLLQVEPVW